MNRSILLLTLLLTASPFIAHTQSDQSDLYDIDGEFSFVRIQYDSYYSGGISLSPIETETIDLSPNLECVT